MARSIKKERKPLSKKFWIIISCVVAVLLIASIIGGIVGYSLSNTKDLNRRFSEYQDVKLNTNELSDLLKKEDNPYKEVFVFVYDSSYMFETDAKDNTSEYKTYLKYVEATKELANFKALVDKSNEVTRENKLKTGFFVIDASLSSNTDILNSDTYASLSSPALISFYVGKVDKKTTYDKLTCLTSSTLVEDTASSEKYSLTGGGSADSFINALKNASDYLKHTYNVSLD